MGSLWRGTDAWVDEGDLEPLGIIDIGSNSVRLVVYEGATRSASPLFNEKVLCGLGRSVASTGKLGSDSIERALAALRRFHAIARSLGIKNLRALATAAVREAADGNQFIALAEKTAGVNIEILSGEKEAELAAFGVRMGFADPDGIIGDLGGGSLELVNLESAGMGPATTLPLGGLRLIDITGDKVDKALTIAATELHKHAWIERGRGRKFYAVGGTWRSLAKMHMEAKAYPLRVMHGYSVSTSEAIAFSEMVRRAKKVTQLPGIAEVARARREVLPYGAAVLERVLKAIEPSEVVFSVFGIREGLLYSLLPKIEKEKDPLLSFCRDFARRRSRSVEHAEELCGWTDVIFQGNGELGETAEERRLRHAACLISDIAWRTNPDYRGEQSLNLIAHGGMSGLDHAGRIFLALAIYYRHMGDDTDHPDLFSERLRNAVSKRVQKRARITGAAVRAAHMLSIGMPGVIDECPLSYDGKSLVLSLPHAHADLDGERLRRRFEALAALLDKTLDIRMG